MRESDKERFSSILTALGITFSRELDRPTFEIYFRALGDLDIQDVSAGAEACLKEMQFFPRPADIRQRAYRGEGQALHVRPEQRALNPKWAEITPEMARQVQELIAAAKIKSMPVLGTDGRVQGKLQPWVMSRMNWRARWDLVQIDPGVRILLDAIPPALRVQFAEEDKANA